MGFSVMFWGAEKRVPAEDWCPYGNNGTLVVYIVIKWTWKDWTLHMLLQRGKQSYLSSWVDKLDSGW